jgi:hypothetical protein
MTLLCLNLGGRWVEWLTQSPSFIFGNEFHYQLNAILDGPHILSGLVAEKKNLLPFPGFEFRVACSVA